MLDIVIPVYNEGANILAVLGALERDVKTPCRVLLCYDFEEDDTLPVVRQSWRGALDVEFVRNRGSGAHGAVVSGFKAGANPYIVVYAADDDYNAAILDAMVSLAQRGHAIVSASRFLPGGSMVNCPPLKEFLVRAASFALHHFAGLPIHDASNG
ncbi:MAG: glycosyltransferase family 2 protein, partial [Vulcanimicrobiaceae bacterium]